MNKKFLAAISLSCAAVMACFSFAACGDEENKDDNSSSQEEQGFVINYEEKTWTYQNAKGETCSLAYGLYLPEAYSETGAKLPLITYVPDSGYVDKTVDYLAEGGECLANWITEEKMSSNPAVFLFLTFSSANAVQEGQEVVGLSDVTIQGSEASQVVEIIDYLVDNYNIDENRLYLTGQSMGGILDWSLNSAYPDKFAATVYVACQPGDNIPDPEAGVVDEMYDAIIAKKEFVNQKFIYITSRLDMKAPMGQDDVEEVLIDAGQVEGTDYVKYYTLDKDDLAASSATINTLLSADIDRYFLAFPWVVSENGNGGFEHLRSFNYCYGIDAIYDWLLSQSL